MSFQALSKRPVRSFGLAALALSVCGLANAGTSSDTMGVSATVAGSCTINAGDMAFGTYDPIVTHASTALDATSTISVVCATGSSATVRLSQGLNPVDGTSTDAAPLRQLVSGANVLSYQLFTDEALSDVWGNTLATGVTHTGTGAEATFTVYGSIPGGQNVPLGAYVDTVTAYIDF